MKGIIYTATNITSGKTYVGQTVSSLHKRQNKHHTVAVNQNSVTHFHRAIRKYGPDNFEWEILKEIKLSNKQKLKSALNKLEVYYIEAIDTFKFGYNMTKGGDGSLGVIPSKESIRKAVEKRKLSLGANTGKKFSKKWRDNMSKSRKKAFAEGRYIPYMRGKKHPKETIQKMKEKKFSKETIQKMKLGSKKRVEVICVETKEVFMSMREASIQLNISKDAVRFSVAKKYFMGEGFHFRLYEGKDIEYTLTKKEKEYCDKYFILQKDENNRDKWIRKLVPEYKPRTNRRTRKIVCLNTNEIFPSIRAVYDKYKFHRLGISNCCKGLQENVCGMRFMYLKDFENGRQSEIKDNAEKEIQRKDILKRRRMSILPEFKCNENNKVYPTIYEALQDLKLPKYKGVYQCLNKQRNSYYNYTFQYIQKGEINNG